MKSPRQIGLSLIECMVVLAISGLLLAVALPRLDGAAFYRAGSVSAGRCSPSCRSPW